MSRAAIPDLGVISRVPAPRSLRDQVLERVSAAIVTGELEAGTLLTVPTLAERFGVSATPVREALLDLEKRGFVTTVRNKGYRITEVRERDLIEIVQLRRLLEVPALRLAAAVFPVERLPEFADMAAAIVGYAAQGDLAGYLAADWRFHRALLELAGNDRLVDLVGELRQQTRMVGLSEMRGTAELRRAAEEHKELLELIAAGRLGEAELLLHDHLGRFLDWWAGRRDET